MWWCSPARKTTTRVLIAATVAFILAACGFRPLYGTNSTGVAVSGELNAVHIAEVKTRVAQRVRNRLISTIAPPGSQAAIRYRLEIFPFEWERDTLVRTNRDVRRRIYNLRVTYKLFDVATKKGLASGNVLAVSSYVRVVSEFANVRAKLDAENRAAVAAADDIKIRLAAYFASK